MKPPVWKLRTFQKRHKGVHTIKHNIWKKIKPLVRLEEVNQLLESHKLRYAWSQFTTEEFALDTPVPKIRTFVALMLKNTDSWTSSKDGRYVFHAICCALSRISPEVFGGDWIRTGELQPSPAASWWTAAIEALGCSFNLMHQIALTTKSVLKSDSKGLRVGGKALTFDIVGKSTMTSAGLLAPYYHS